MRWSFLKSVVPKEIADAGRRWRAAHTLEPLAADAEVLFAIPLKGKAVSNDWQEVSSRLQMTLQSLLAQTDGRWRAVICGQDRPEALPDDPRLEFLPYSLEARAGLMDKRDKLNLIYRHIEGLAGWDGYVFNLDADDVLHPKLVQYFLEQRSPAGYLLSRGYMYDASTGEFAALEPKSLKQLWAKPFYRQCGSCSAIRVDLRNGPGFVELLRVKGKHRSQRERLAAFGIELEDVGFPAAAYVVNHGDNDQTRRGYATIKMDYFHRNRLAGEREIEARQLFGFA